MDEPLFIQMRNSLPYAKHEGLRIFLLKVCFGVSRRIWTRFRYGLRKNFFQKSAARDNQRLPIRAKDGQRVPWTVG
ncbi:MAG: hypothetical protein ACXWIU_08185 [Limisphaerales bacterium]